MNRITMSLESAVDMCCTVASLPGIDGVEIDKAGGRICAEDIVSDIDVPGFRRSAVDGYAIHSADLEKTYSNFFEIEGIIAAGQNPKFSVRAGKCIRVMTGSVLPSDTAAVVKQEDTTLVEDQKIIIDKILVKGENISLPGSVIRKGERLVVQGDILDPGKVEKMASAGWAKVPVYKVPRVYVINTGSELVLPGKYLDNGKIYHSNRSYLLSKIEKIGCRAIAGSPEVRDKEDLIVNAIKMGIKMSDLLIISGGTANGDYDLVISSLKQLNANIIFSSVQVKPGRNITAAIIGGTLIFNFPGNPHAVGILFDTVVRPVLKKIKGIKEYHNNWVNIRLSRDIPHMLNIRSLYRAELIEREAAFFARPLAKKENYSGIRPVIIDLQPGQGRQGDIVKGLIL